MSHRDLNASYVSKTKIKNIFINYFITYDIKISKKY